MRCEKQFFFNINVLFWLHLQASWNNKIISIYLLIIICSQSRKDLLQLMLNAHRDTDVNEDQNAQSYEEGTDKWKQRGTVYIMLFHRVR